MTAQRSRAEVDMVTMWNGPVPDALFDASRGIDSACMEYHRPITLERTFNALRDAVTQAEATIDKYHNLTEAKS